MEYTELNEQDTEVLRHAIKASNRLYVRGIQEVGAAVRTTTGQIFSGIHFETSTGFANVCGEIAAICCMVSAGHRDLDTIAAVWRDSNGEHYLLPPCGRCREVISDFNPEAWVIVTTMQGHWDVAAIDRPGKVQIADLLPLKSHKLGNSMA
ncbi:MAG: cytidine deaminase [Chloroflexi bacterium]|nr:cytidine deaminase [Chloroflexota bacterium]